MIDRDPALKTLKLCSTRLKHFPFTDRSSLEKYAHESKLPLQELLDDLFHDLDKIIEDVKATKDIDPERSKNIIAKANDIKMSLK